MSREVLQGHSGQWKPQWQGSCTSACHVNRSCHSSSGRRTWLIKKTVPHRATEVYVLLIVGSSVEAYRVAFETACSDSEGFSFVGFMKDNIHILPRCRQKCTSWWHRSGRPVQKLITKFFQTRGRRLHVGLMLREPLVGLLSIQLFSCPFSWCVFSKCSVKQLWVLIY